MTKKNCKNIIERAMKKKSYFGVLPRLAEDGGKKELRLELGVVATLLKPDLLGVNMINQHFPGQKPG